MLGLLLGLLGYGRAPKTTFRLSGLVRKNPLYYGKLPEKGGSLARL